MRPIAIRITRGERRTISMILGGKVVTIPPNHPKFEEIEHKLLNQDYEDLDKLTSPEAQFREKLAAVGIDADEHKITILHGEAYMDGIPLAEVLGVDNEEPVS